jgi:hypothetical protein
LIPTGIVDGLACASAAFFCEGQVVAIVVASRISADAPAPNAIGRSAVISMTERASQATQELRVQLDVGAERSVRIAPHDWAIWH